MSQVQLQPGIYTNVFPVNLPAEDINVMVAPRSSFPDLRPLRNEIIADAYDVKVYATGNYVYGYGKDLDQLASKGFHEEQIALSETPYLSGRLVIDGLIEKSKTLGFIQDFIKGRVLIFRKDPFGLVSNGKVKVLLGYDLRCTYYEAVRSLGLTVDITWAFRDEHDQPLNTHQVRERGAMNDVAVIQEEYLRGTTQFNLQIAQIRMHNYLLPFAQEFQIIPLPCGGQAQLETEPFRVILGGRL